MKKSETEDPYPYSWEEYQKRGALRLVHLIFVDKLSLDDVAKRAGVSNDKLDKIIKEYVSRV